MQKKLSRSMFASLAALTIPYIALAQTRSTTVDPQVTRNTQDIVMLDNPLTGITSVSGFISAVIDVVLVVAVPVLVLAFIWLGFQFILAQGNSAKLDKVKQNLWYTIIGVAIVLSAKAISTLIEATFRSL